MIMAKFLIYIPAAPVFMLLAMALAWITGRLVKTARRRIGAILLLTAWAYGLLVAIYAGILTYFSWGVLGLIISVLLFGVGVVPAAVLGTLLDGQYSFAIAVVVMVAIGFAARIQSVALMDA